MASSVTLVIDCRESALVASVRALQQQQQEQTASSIMIPLQVRALDVGDALLEWRRREEAVVPVLLVERKTIPDLLSSFVDGRYAEQSLRLAHHGAVPPHNVVYLLEGSLSAARPADREKCLCALTSCLFFKGFSPMRTESVEDTARFLLSAAGKIARDLAAGKRPRYTSVPLDGGGEGEEEGAAAAAAPTSYASVVVSSVKKKNMTAANIGAILLAQLPGFSAVSAECVMAAVGGSLDALLRALSTKEDRDRLAVLQLTPTRRLGTAAVARLCAFLRPEVAAAEAEAAPAVKVKKAAGQRKKKVVVAAAAAAAPEELTPLPPKKKRRAAVGAEEACHKSSSSCAFNQEEEE